MIQRTLRIVETISNGQVQSEKQETNSNSNSSNSSQDVILSIDQRRERHDLWEDDLLGELSSCYESYSIGKSDARISWIGVSNISLDLNVILDKLKCKRVGKGTFSSHALSYFFIEHALDTCLDPMEEFKLLRKMKHRLDKSEHLGDNKERHLYGLFRQYLAIPLESGRRQTVRVPELFKERLNGTAGIIGVDSGKLACILIMRSVARLEGAVHSGIRDKFDTKTNEFLELLRLKALGIQGAMMALGSGKVGYQ